MHPGSSGRFTFVAQWVLAVILPAFGYVGRGLVGAELGWMAVIGIAVYGLPTIVLLLVPPLVTLLDKGRPRGGVRKPYAVATWVQWGALVLAGLTIPDAGDNGHLLSALSRWTGLSYETSEAIFYVAFAILVLAWLAALVVAVERAIRSRRMPIATP